ncbi:hypothetical protein HMPREF1865_01176, partial [Veillonella parvula]
VPTRGLFNLTRESCTIDELLLIVSVPTRGLFNLTQEEIDNLRRKYNL